MIKVMVVTEAQVAPVTMPVESAVVQSQEPQFVQYNLSEFEGNDAMPYQFFYEGNVFPDQPVVSRVQEVEPLRDHRKLAAGFATAAVLFTAEAAHAYLQGKGKMRKGVGVAGAIGSALGAALPYAKDTFQYRSHVHALRQAV